MVRKILGRIVEDGTSMMRGNMTALLVLAKARGILEAVEEELNKMPITVDMRSFSFLRKAIDDTAKTAVATILRTRFPKEADLDPILEGVNHENVEAWIVRVMKAKSLDEVSGARNASSFEEAIGPELDDLTQTLE